MSTEEKAQAMEQICKDREEHTKDLSNIEIVQKLVVMGDAFVKAKDNKEIFSRLSYLNYLLASELLKRLMLEEKEKNAETVSEDTELEVTEEDKGESDGVS